jgi:hypothetical protein
LEPYVSYQIYKVLHLLGMFMVFSALGGAVLHAINGGDRESNKARGLVAATHGIGMLLIITGGMGMGARLGILSDGFPPWIHAKLGLWLLIGGALVVPNRAPAAAKFAWFGIPLLGALAAYIAIYKPF